MSKITITLYVGDVRQRAGEIEEVNLRTIISVLKAADNYRAEAIEVASVVFMIQTHDRVLVNARVNRSVAGTMKILFALWLHTAAEKPGAARQTAEQHNNVLWRLAKQMYTDGFGQKPNANACSVEGCTGTCRGTKDDGPQIAVDSTGAEWPICGGHFDAGQFVDGLAKKTEAALEAAVHDGDAPAIERQNKVMRAINGLGDPITVFASNKAREAAARPKGTMAAALEKVVAGEPEQEPELTKSTAVGWLANYFDVHPLKGFNPREAMTTNGETWLAAKARLDQAVTPSKEKAKRALERAKRAYEFLTAERMRQTSHNDDDSSGPETTPGATSGDGFEVALGVPEGAIIN
jgi:hypothetical protein